MHCMMTVGDLCKTMRYGHSQKGSISSSFVLLLGEALYSFAARQCRCRARFRSMLARFIQESHTFRRLFRLKILGALPSLIVLSPAASLPQVLLLLPSIALSSTTLLAHQFHVGC
ncbi:uncharacterized protein LOC119313022 [Triticum dicoccoides]|uniref:uncharacterized protein LOC119313022 n=1 Tax=Triticum dicoccoides TaxID=85692 RepID=UPI00189172A2|nr:uncharacterized protein LOC119313022 [Triticum dicoccoides]